MVKVVLWNLAWMNWPTVNNIYNNTPTVNKTKKVIRTNMNNQKELRKHYKVVGVARIFTILSRYPTERISCCCS